MNTECVHIHSTVQHFWFQLMKLDSYFGRLQALYPDLQVLQCYEWILHVLKEKDHVYAWPNSLDSRFYWALAFAVFLGLCKIANKLENKLSIFCPPFSVVFFLPIWRGSQCLYSVIVSEIQILKWFLVEPLPCTRHYENHIEWIQITSDIWPQRA